MNDEVDLDGMNERMDQINKIMVGCNRTEALTILAELTAIALYGYGLDHDKSGFVEAFSQRVIKRATQIRAELGGDGFPPEDGAETLQ